MPIEDEFEAETARLKAEYGDLFEAVAEILFRHDPVGINFGGNPDEYYPEVETILPLLKTCHSVEDVMSAVHQEFVRWFNQDLAGPKEGYREIAKDIWEFCQERPSQAQSEIKSEEI